MIVVGKVDEVFLQVSCERHIAYELNEYFSFKDIYKKGNKTEFNI